MIYKYTVEAYNDSPMGKLDAVSIVVHASDDSQAFEKAAKIKQRQSYNISKIEELLGDNRPDLKKKD